MFMDSLDKVIGVYLGNLCREEFEYKGKTYKPRDLRVSPMIFRGFTCPSGCAGCCRSWTLDYLSSDALPRDVVERLITINGVAFPILSDFQSENSNYFCKHVDWKSGRCGIYTQRPLTCDFELIRFLVPKTGPVHLTQKLFGRAWTMKRTDGGRGAKCEMLAPSEHSQKEVVRKLERLAMWSDHFRIETCLPTVIKWVRTGPHPAPLFIPVHRKNTWLPTAKTQ